MMPEEIPVKSGEYTPVNAYLTNSDRFRYDENTRKESKINLWLIFYQDRVNLVIATLFFMSITNKKEEQYRVSYSDEEPDLSKQRTETFP